MVGRSGLPVRLHGDGLVMVGDTAGFVDVPRQVQGTVVRERPLSFGDHFSQATLYWNSMTPPERDHIVAAFSFELAKCVHPEVRERMLGNLANVDAELCERVATNLGMPAPTGSPAADAGSSPALSLVPGAPGPIAGRVVGVLVGDGVDDAGVEAVKGALRQPLVFDGRNLYDPARMAALGITYHGIGRAPADGPSDRSRAEQPEPDRPELDLLHPHA